MSERPSVVAVVDDEDSMRLALARVLRESSYVVTAYVSGEEFLAALQTSPPDCVVIDQQLPGLTGTEVQRALRATDSQLPVIFLTAHDSPAVRAECLADGAFAYFTKPLRRSVLLAAVRDAISRKSPPEP